MLFSQIYHPTELVIPPEVTRCSVLVRHSLSVQDGPDETRTLTGQGAMLCEAVAQDYQQLFALLAGRLGFAAYGYSGLPRALVTAWMIARPTHARPDDRLRLKVSLKRIQGGAWYKAKLAAKATVGAMLSEVAANPDLVADQPYDEAMHRMGSFFWRGYGGAPLSIGFGHEPEPSLYMAARNLVPTELIGLDECQAYIALQLGDDSAPVLSVIKFVPEASIRPAA